MRRGQARRGRAGHGQATISAVFATLVRATVDARTAVVLRTGGPERAQELARWLEQAHGTRRLVIASQTHPAEIEVRLPARLIWPALPSCPPSSVEALAAHPPARHLSPMPLSLPATGRA